MVIGTFFHGVDVLLLLLCCEARQKRERGRERDRVCVIIMELHSVLSEQDMYTDTLSLFV